jgi:hypothetical protein
MLPEELSPANGVPTPGVPGFLGTGSLSDRVESLMLSFHNCLELEEAVKSNTPSNYDVLTSP